MVKTGVPSKLLLAFLGGAIVGSGLFTFIITFRFLKTEDNTTFDIEPSIITASPRARNTTANKKSKRHEWKLWNEMSPEDQEIMLERAFARAKPYGIMAGGEKDVSKFHSGEHMVCGPQPEGSCNFLSFGIRDDPSFDIHLGKEWNCRGFAGDPSIAHKSKLSPEVTFHNIGLTMLRSNAEQRRDPKDEWILSSLPQIKKFLGWDYISIVKIDCEGCELAIARDILTEDPSFLENVGQISIETHATKTWINTTEELYYYALMFPLLEDAGFSLVWSSVFGCGKYEHDGCMPEINGKMSMPCGSRRRNKVNHVPIGWSCHDWLWARV